MLTPLYNKKPDRIFAFGCSYTSWKWSMWPELLKYVTGIDTYNYGQWGISNYYIANQIVLANKLHQFSNNDLIIVVWTEPDRNENLCNHNSQNHWTWKRDKKKHPEYIASKLVQQLALISSVMSSLNNSGAQIHHSSMTNFGIPGYTIPQNCKKAIFNVYQKELSKFLPSFEEILTLNMQEREQQLKLIFKEKFFDLHPFPSQSLQWLDTVFDYDFSNAERGIHEHEQEIINSIKTVVLDPSYSPGPEFPGIDYRKISGSAFLVKKIDPDHNSISWHKIIKDSGLSISTNYADSSL